MLIFRYIPWFLTPNTLAFQEITFKMYKSKDPEVRQCIVVFFEQLQIGRLCGPKICSTWIFLPVKSSYGCLPILTNS